MTRRAWAVLLALALTVSACSSGGEDPELVAAPGAPQGWVELPPAPILARHEARAVWVDGTLLVFGGRDTPPCPPNADCALPDAPALSDGARFDPADRTWEPIAPMPVPFEYASTAVVDEDVYVYAQTRIDGAWGQAFLHYDLATDTWQELALPAVADLWSYTLEAADDHVVLVTGSHENGRQPDLRFDAERGVFDELPADPFVPAYDRDLTWVDGAWYLTAIRLDVEAEPRRYAVAVLEDEGWRELPEGDVIGWNPEWLALDGRLVNAQPGGSDGGETNGFGATFPFGGVFDPATGTWSPLPAAPPDPGLPLQLQLGHEAIGDDRLALAHSGLVLLPDEDRWAPLRIPAPIADWGAAAAVGDGRLWVFGGAEPVEGAGVQLRSDLWMFTP